MIGDSAGNFRPLSLLFLRPSTHTVFSMTPTTISAEVVATFSDWSGEAVPHLTDVVPLAIGQGIEGDADHVFVATFAEDHVRCGIVCGSTLLVGASIRWALNRYCAADRDHAEHLLDRFRAQAAEDLQNGGTTFRFLRGSDERWRSFRGEQLLGFEELLARVVRETN